ncbi:MAG: LamG domain-containing protein [Alphaproteobacteria bacterium]|nr:MAG: LamG domain-containing protein [Alphaproteobacteria bacterium]
MNMYKMKKNTTFNKKTKRLEVLQSTIFILVVLCIGLISAFTDQLNQSLIIYYKLDDTTGNVIDATGNGNDAVASGGITRGAGGLINKSFQFDGVDDGINRSNVGSQFGGNKEFSVSMWVNLSSNPADNDYIFTIGNLVNPSRALSINVNKYISYRDAVDGTQTADNKAITQDVWTHIVLVYNGTGATIYENSTKVIAVADAGAIDATPRIIIGWFDKSYLMNGLIDEIGIWNRSLSLSEISELYNNGAGLPYISAPVITLNSPINYYNTTNTSLVMNCSATYSTGLTNLSLYIDGNLNYTVYNSTANQNLSLQLANNFSLGNYNWTCKARNFDNVEGTTSTRFFTINTFVENSQTYNPTTTEGNVETFTINLTYDTSVYENSLATLYYNNTAYVGTKTTSGSNTLFTRNVTVPTLSANTNITFYWEVVLVDGGVYNYYNSTFHNQTVNNLGVDDCTAYTTLFLNLSLKDEKLKTLINGTLYNSSIEIDIDIYPIGSSTPLIEYHQNFSKNNTPRICLQSDLANSNYKLDAQILYGADGYAEEYYYIQQYVISNSSLPQNIDLYDLDDDNSQEFKITYKDGTFLPVADALIQIQRKYVSDGISRTVEIPKTDSNGETTAHLELGDVVYTLMVIKNGVTLATFDEIIPVCQTPSLSECKISLNSFNSHIEPEEFNVLDDFVFTLTYNTTTRTVQSIFSVPSSTVSTITLNVTKYDQLGNTSVCDDSLTSASGTLSCTVPTAFGNGTVIAKLYKDNELIGEAYFSMKQKPSDLYGSSLVFLSIFLYMTLIGVGLSDNAMITGFFIIIGLILSVALNITSTGLIGFGASALWLILAIIFILIKGVKRE